MSRMVNKTNPRFSKKVTIRRPTETPTILVYDRLAGGHREIDDALKVHLEIATLPESSLVLQTRYAAQFPNAGIPPFGVARRYAASRQGAIDALRAAYPEAKAYKVVSR